MNSYVEVIWGVIGGETSKDGVEKKLKDSMYMFERKDDGDNTWFRIPVEGGDVIIRQMRESVSIEFDRDVKEDGGWRLVI